jgi:hypothetical protein
MTPGDIKRWMYHGKRPNWIAKVLNRLWSLIASSGIAPHVLVTLEVVGRQSGRLVSLPLVLAVVDGERYLVSMLGENVNWVQNVRAAGGRAVLRHGGRDAVRLEAVPVGQRPAILKAYLQRAPGARPHIRVHKDAPLAEFTRIAPSIPVFRITPATQQVHSGNQARA